jgi:hypothetical protein
MLAKSSHLLFVALSHVKAKQSQYTPEDWDSWAGTGTEEVKLGDQELASAD